MFVTSNCGHTLFLFFTLAKVNIAKKRQTKTVGFFTRDILRGTRDPSCPPTAQNIERESKTQTEILLSYQPSVFRNNNVVKDEDWRTGPDFKRLTWHVACDPRWILSRQWGEGITLKDIIGTTDRLGSAVGTIRSIVSVLECSKRGDWRGCMRISLFLGDRYSPV